MQEGLLWVLWIASVVVGIYGYCSLRIELKLTARKTLTRTEWEERSRAIVADLESLRNHLRQAAAEPRMVIPVRGAEALNLNRRGQVLRLHGKGRTPAEIASELQISKGEVELLVKVNDWPADEPVAEMRRTAAL